MLHLETTKDFEFYPEQYLNDIAERLECPIEKLSIIYEIGDIDEIGCIESIIEEKILNDFEVEQLEILDDEYPEVCIGSIEFLKMKFQDGFELKVIVEQNASPIGIWINDDEIENLQNQIRK
jgi:hypothetical protein